MREGRLWRWLWYRDGHCSDILHPNRPRLLERRDVEKEMACERIVESCQTAMSLKRVGDGNRRVGLIPLAGILEY